MINENFIKRKIQVDARTQDVTSESYLRRLSIKHGLTTKTILNISYPFEERKALLHGVGRTNKPVGRPSENI